MRGREVKVIRPFLGGNSGKCLTFSSSTASSSSSNGSPYVGECAKKMRPRRRCLFPLSRPRAAASAASTFMPPPHSPTFLRVHTKQGIPIKRRESKKWVSKKKSSFVYPPQTLFFYRAEKGLIESRVFRKRS